MSAACDVLYRNIHQLVTLSDGPHEGGVRGEELARADALEGAALAVRDGCVLDFGPDAEIAEKYSARAELDLEGYVAVPGFVDAHTHPAFGATREAEFLLRSRGADYVEIAKAGGGILSSVASLRETSEDELEALVRERIRRMIACGTTTIEAKSGYGLDLESERKSLEVLQRVGESMPITMSRTLLAAHEVAPEYRDDKAAWVREIRERILPELRELADSCDVFVEGHVFDLDETRAICARAKDLGYRVRLHVDELSPLGGTELAVELGAASADHLACIFPSDPGCTSAADTDEHEAGMPCDDGLDNDGDGLPDYPSDPGCRNPQYFYEAPQCDDDLDNDGDGFIDWDGGIGGGTPDPFCGTLAWKNKEKKTGCGLGFEVGLLVPLWWSARRARGARRRR